MKFLKSNGLLIKVILAIITGALLGSYTPESLTRVMVTFNSLFANLLSFSIPLIIVGLVTPAIASIGQGAKKLLLITVVLAYGSTLFSGMFTYLVSDYAFPFVITPELTGGSSDLLETAQLKPYFSIEMTPIMGVMAALILSFILGIGGSILPGSSSLRGVYDDFKSIIERYIVAVIIPLLPLHIFGLFLHMSAVGQAMPIILLFSQVIAIIFALHILLLLIQFTIAGIVVKRNPLILLKNMLPAYFTALGTQSSAATIPVTLFQVKKNNVKDEIAEFVVPLCATIHLAGSTMKIVACAMALMMMTNHPYDLTLMIGFICMLGIAMVAAPGVPGGAIMAAIGILQGILGFDDQLQALMIALYIAMDSFGTACNVTGDGAIALIVDKISDR
ncbi:MAG: dicarboxylate/amino acid:cation symporter [Bacteroidales bacterium]